MRRILLTVVAVLGVAGLAGAQENKLLPHRSTAGPQDHTMERAGQPRQLSHFAKPGIEKHEGPGLIGGGKLIHGDGPVAYDGTFGWDYQGLGWRPGRVFLGWAHDRKHQPKMGPYRTDTHKVPDVVTLHPVRKVLEQKEP